MDVAILLFLTSGLFLGWSLGTNDAANVFGTAVGTRMLRFTTATAICSAFVILGAVTGGTGPAETLGRLGGVNTLPGAFMAALAAAAAIYGMSRLGLPVSTTQAIVGAIIGWSLFTATTTDAGTLGTIVATWVIGPVIAAVIAIALFVLTKRLLSIVKLHLVRVDAYTRLGLVVAGAFGAYSLGANNIANVMGVFVPAAPFGDLDILGLVQLSPDATAFPARRHRHQRRRVHTLQAGNDDGGQWAHALVAGDRVGRCRGAWAGAVRLRFGNNRRMAPGARTADDPPGASLKHSGGGRCCSRHRFAQGRPRPSLAGAGRHWRRVGAGAIDRAGGEFRRPVYPPERFPAAGRPRARLGTRSIRRPVRPDE